MLKLLRRLVSEEEGQGLVEYALIIGLVAVVLIVALSSMQVSISSVFEKITGKLNAIPTPP